MGDGLKRAFAHCKATRGVYVKGLGTMPAKLVEELQPGDIRFTDAGERLRVLSVIRRGRFMAIAMERKDGTIFTQHKLPTTVVAIGASTEKDGPINSFGPIVHHE